MSLTVSIVVAAPIEEVWRRLTDVERWPDWNPACAFAECDTPEVGVGSRLRLQLRHPRGRLFWTLPTIAEMSPPHRFVLMTRALGFHAPLAFALTEDEAGTRVVLTSHSSGPLAFTYRLMFPEKNQGLLWSGALTGLARAARAPSDAADRSPGRTPGDFGNT